MSGQNSMTKPIVAGILLAVAVAAVIRLGGKKNSTQQENPFDYDLSSLRKTEAKWLKYDEIAAVNPGLESLTAITALESGFAVAGSGVVVIFNGEGQESGRFTTGLKILSMDFSGDLYIATENHVEVYALDGSKKAAWDAVEGPALFTGLAVYDNHLFAADAGNKVVWHYQTDGRLLGEIGQKDPARDIEGFIIPSPYFDVAVSPAGDLWVANTGRHQMENYTFDGRLRSSWKKSAWQVEGFCGCCNPTHFTILANGDFVTSEKGLPRVKIIAPTGELKAVVAGPESFDEDVRGLDVAVDAQSRILVMDPASGTVRRFVEKSL